MKAIEFLNQPIVIETKKVMVPVYDDYLEKEEEVPGIIYVFQNPVDYMNNADLKLETKLCYGVTEFESNQIFHTQPISK